MRRVTLARLVLALAFAQPHVADAQGLSAVLRAGVGVDGERQSVFGGQIELVDFGASTSVEIALAAFEGTLVEDYRGATPGAIGPDVHDYHEDTRVRGAGPIASVLIGHGPRDSRGPYLAVGLGIGVLDVVWHVESPTDRDLGTRLPAGGSMRDEKILLPGALGSLGLGFRFHRRLDLRAQALSQMVPSTNEREDAKFLTTLMLTAGVGF